MSGLPAEWVAFLQERAAIVAVVVVAGGVGLAFAARAAIRGLAARFALGGRQAAAVRLFASVAFWGATLAAGAAALRLLGEEASPVVLDPLLRFLPRVLVGIIVAGVAHLVGSALRDLAARSAGIPILGVRGAYWVVFGPGLIVGAQQLGIEVDFLVQLAVVALAAFLLSLGLAFALGARRHVANLIAGAELNRYREGDRLRVDGVEGRIVEVRRTAVVLESAAGTVTVPASRFAETPVVRLTEPD